MKLFFYSSVLLGAVGIAFFGVLRRWVMKGGLVSPMLFLIFSNAAATLLFFGIYISVWGLSIPGILPGFWTAVFITAGANVFIQLLNARSSSLVAGEVSLTAPLQALTPGLITIVALTLGEFPGKIGVGGRPGGMIRSSRSGFWARFSGGHICRRRKRTRPRS